jgi:hypothetical protein
MSDNQKDNLISEAQTLHLTQYIHEVVKNMTMGKLSIKDHDVIIEISIIMH